MWNTLVKWKKLDEVEYKRTMTELVLFTVVPSLFIGVIIGLIN